MGIHAAGAFLVAVGIILILLIFFPTNAATLQAGVQPSSLPDTTPYRIMAAASLLVCGIYILIFANYKKNADEAVRVLMEGLARRGGDAAPTAWSDLVAVSRAAAHRMTSCEAEAEKAIADMRRVQEQRIDELTETHNDLATHHRFTKKMLQSLRSEDVYDTLLEGVRDGFGFRSAILGLRNEHGDVVFGGPGDLDGRESVSVPCWDEGSLVARSLWDGNQVLVSSIREHRHRFEDRIIMGEGAAFLVPISKKKTLLCSDVKGCGKRECPAFSRENVRCWTESGACRAGQVPDCDRRRECVGCEMFAASALLVVRGRPDSRPFTRDTTRSIATLSAEASLALEIVELYENARRMSMTDSLTGLVNHKEFFNAVRRELDRARRYQHTVSLLMIDVDDFKKYNDLYGHLAGDVALRQIADLLRGCARATDIIARYGGEEFGVVLPESTPGGALMLAERIKTEIARTDFMPQVPGGVRLTVSIGIFSAEGGAVSEDQLVGFADEAAYLAKNSGKNRVVVKAHA